MRFVVGLLNMFWNCVCCVPVVVVYVIHFIYISGNNSKQRSSTSQQHSRSKQAFHAILCFAQQKWFQRRFKILRPYLREVLTLFEVMQLNHLFACFFQPPDSGSFMSRSLSGYFDDLQVNHLFVSLFDTSDRRQPKTSLPVLGYPSSWMILSAVMLCPTVLARHGWSNRRSSLPTFLHPESLEMSAPSIQQHDLRPTTRQEIPLQQLSQRSSRPAFQPATPSLNFDITLKGKQTYFYSINDSSKVHNICSEPSILSANKATEYSPEQTIVVDTGSSFGLTPYDEDIIYTLKEGDLGSVSTVNNSRIALTKLGYAEYFIRDTNGNDVPIYPIVFVIPGTSQRLLSPQEYAQTIDWREDSYIEEHDPDMYGGTDNYFWFALNRNWQYAGCSFSPRSNLPHFQVRRRCSTDPPSTFQPRFTDAQPTPRGGKDYGPDDKVPHSSYCTCKAPSEQTVNNITTYAQENAQLTPAQRTLLLWHSRLGHRGFQHVQRLFSSCDSSKGSPFNTEDCPPCLPLPSGITKQQINKCTVPLCLACELAKATKRGPDTFRGLKLPEKEMNLKTDDLRPGDRISIDHYECPDRGRLRTTFG
jgi:GAG-pre-integrase domain